MIDSHLQEALNPPPSQSAIDLYDFICSKTRITCDKVPVAREDYLSDPYDGGRHNIHPFFGLARDLYRLLDSIEKLVRQNATSNIATPSDYFLASKAQSIQKSLQKWTAPSQLHHSSPQLIRDSIMAAEAIRWAAKLHLHQVMAWEASHQTNQQSMVQNILDAISHIPPGSPVNGQLLLPLFLAGVTATRKTHRLQIEYRISLLESSIGMGNIASAHQFLDLAWRRGREKNTNWETFFPRDHPYVVLC